MSEKIYKCLEIKNLKDMLKKSGEKYGEKNAYKIRLEKNKYKTYTHKDVRQMINYLGTRLIDLGLKNKWMGNSIFIYSMWNRNSCTIR